jgi:hypothetical protein
MSPSEPEPVTIFVDDAVCVAGLLQSPRTARPCYELAHGMAHPFMEAVDAELAERDLVKRRFQFPCIEKGGNYLGGLRF